MTEMRDAVERRVLILAPHGNDAQELQGVLSHVGVHTLVCIDLATLCREATIGAAALLVAEEALSAANHDALAAVLSQQPSWSDLPLLILASGESTEQAYQSFASLGNIILLERPAHDPTLLSAVRLALRARDRQYELRDRHAVQALLASIVESSDDAIVSKTLEGVILSWNGGAERMFGYTAEEAVGKHITLIIPPERHHEARTIIDRIMRGERVDDFETVRVTKSGAVLDITLSVSPVRDVSNVIIGASKVARDITAQKRSERALREADRRKDEFLATLAHELRNPLAPLRNALGLLGRVGDSKPALDHLRGLMERQVDLMVRLVDDLMEVSRITRGRIELRKQPVALSDLVEAALETSQPLITAAGLEIELDLPEEPLILDADPARLIQVFANLLNNATKYGSDSGPIRITARRDADDVTVSIRDYGIGIPSDMLTKVFDMFTQVDSARNERQAGLGIGLTLVRGLVQMHGGHVTAASEGAGKGSEFTVRLPLAKGVAADRESAPGPTPSMPPVRVLVVDDNRDSADSLGMLLESLGADVQVVYDGPTALEWVESFRPRMVLLDLRMPGMDGYEVARTIRDRSPNHDLKLVALSGWGQEEDRQRSRLAGFDLHLVKPASLEALRALIPSAETRPRRTHVGN